MPVPYFPHSGRRKHYWKLRSEDFRELMTKHRWGFRGAYAEKSIRGQRVMQTIVKVRWPITPDLDPTQLDQESLVAIGEQARVCVDSVRERIRAMYPGLTEVELNEWLM